MDETAFPIVVNNFSKQNNTKIYENGTSDRKLENKIEFKTEFEWTITSYMIGVHLLGFYGLYLILTGSAPLALAVWGYFLYFWSVVGICGGSHRLWSHRSYKGNIPCRLFFMVIQTLAHQSSIYVWCKYHRCHHKYADTDGDPHNSRRGFFFSHLGWVVTKEHPYVTEKMNSIDMSDLEKDEIVMFQKKYFKFLVPIISYFLPAFIPYYFWGYEFWQAFYICSAARYVVGLHSIMAVNSVAHAWGFKPFDKSIYPVENPIVSFFAVGEGYHNYHHIFPWDYKAAEFGTEYFNPTALVITFFGKIGWAYDLKTASRELVRQRILKKGDGSHMLSKEKNVDNLVKYLDHELEDKVIYGWTDKDMADCDKENVVITNKSD